MMEFVGHRRRGRAIAFATATFVTCALVLTGCGAKLSGGGDATPTGEQKLVYWSAYSEGTPAFDTFSKALKEFGEANHVEVEAKAIGAGGVDALAAAIKDGKVDLVDSDTAGIAAQRERQQTADMDAVLDETIPGTDKTLGESISASALKVSRDADGKLAVLPWGMTSTALWFDAVKHPDLVGNKTVTWDQFRGLLDEIKSSGHAPLAQDGTAATYNVFWFYWAMMRFAGPGSLKGLSEDASNWDAPAVHQAAALVQELADGGYFQKDFEGSKYPLAQNEWAEGKYDFILNGTWLLSETSQQMSDSFKPRSIQFPTVPDGSDSVEVGVSGWSIASTAPHAEIAAKFLAFVSQTKYQTQISDAQLGIPVRTDVPAAEPFTDVQQAINGASDVHTQYDGAWGTTWWNDIMLPLSTDLLTGRISADEMIAKGKDQTAKLLERTN